MCWFRPRLYLCLYPSPYLCFFAKPSLCHGQLFVLIPSANAASPKLHLPRSGTAQHLVTLSLAAFSKVSTFLHHVPISSYWQNVPIEVPNGKNRCQLMFALRHIPTGRLLEEERVSGFCGLKTLSRFHTQHASSCTISTQVSKYWGGESLFVGNRRALLWQVWNLSRWAGDLTLKNALRVIWRWNMTGTIDLGDGAWEHYLNVYPFEFLSTCTTFAVIR